MKYLLALVLSIFQLCQARACDRDLTGTWKSDKSMSMDFIRDKSKIEPKTDAFLNALLGKMTLTFTNGNLYVIMPETRVPVSGEMRPFAGFEEKKLYKVLFCSSAMIVWSAKRSFGEDDVATTFNFEAPDLAWVYTGSTVPETPDMHTREYFRRVR
ncbi:hypothetical protein [Massilia pseudoviolaceinigra]|uniref:hypothetical protein n=1 Tax=Massilia pseudoviolaceinigra TaxID=3057165 RepID=UPI002796E01B|nr:hypothetical protein [Massilia sp. CCM 9206]MDQ1924613.1 hypothetical protein [Massilia sp. CCM 9206]